MDWTFLLTILSVAVGWFLNELSQVFRSHGTNRRVKKQVLYHLLEINHLFRQLNNQTIIEQIKRKSISLLPSSDQHAELESKIELIVQYYVAGAIEDNALDDLQQLELDFKNSLDELAKTAPIRAFFLRGKTSIWRAFDDIAEYYSDMRRFSRNNPDFEKVLNDFEKRQKSEIIVDALEDVKHAIRALSLSLGFLTWWRVKRQIPFSAEPMNEKDFNEMWRTLEPMLIQFVNDAESKVQ